MILFVHDRSLQRKIMGNRKVNGADTLHLEQASLVQGFIGQLRHGATGNELGDTEARLF